MRKIWESNGPRLTGFIKPEPSCQHEDLRRLAQVLMLEADAMETAEAKSTNDAIIGHGYIERGR